MRNISIIVLILVVVSCSSRYEGYSDLGDDLFKKQITLGEDGNAALITDYYGILLTYNPDSANQMGTYLLVHPEELHNYFQHEELLRQINGLKEGEIVRFILSKSHVTELFARDSSVYDEKQMCGLEIKMDQRFSENDNICNYFMLQAQEGFMPEMDAIKLCQSTMDKTWEDFGKISMCWVNKTEGDSVKAGREISIEYNTYWLDGVRQDSLTSMTMPFGKPGQLIPGLQYGLSLMKEGERAMIYMPSELAFGEEGSKTGIIPARTPIYFDVRVSNVVSESE